MLAKQGSVVSKQKLDGMTPGDQDLVHRQPVRVSQTCCQTTVTQPMIDVTRCFQLGGLEKCFTYSMERHMRHKRFDVLFSMGMNWLTLSGNTY